MPNNKSALLVVDLQNDFIPGGALAIKDGDQVIPMIDQLVHCKFDVKVATKDWHPENHGSFAATHKKKPGDIISLDGLRQILWPIHCVHETTGADFTPGWNTKKIERIFYKGIDEKIDSYSTFYDNGHLRSTGLEDFLRSKHVTDLYVAGLATDYCVKYSVIDACTLGFTTYVIIDACRGVNLQTKDTEKAIKEMQEAGAYIISFEETLKKKI